MPLRPPDPPLADDLVLLRPPEDGDMPAIVAACQDPEISRWTRVPSPYGEAEGLAFIERSRSGWAAGTDAALIVLDALHGALLGATGLHAIGGGTAEIGYWVAREARGRGIAARAARLVARWAVCELGLARVSLCAEPENAASQRVAEKAGFQREGVLRSFVEIKGVRRDIVMFSLLRSDLP